MQLNRHMIHGCLFDLHTDEDWWYDRDVDDYAFDIAPDGTPSKLLAFTSGGSGRPIPRVRAVAVMKQYQATYAYKFIFRIVDR